LSKIQAESKKDSAQKQLISNVITNTRLNSEIEQKSNVDFSSIEEKFKLDAEEKKMLQTQKDLFKKQQETVNTKIDILNKKVQQIQEEIKAVLSQKYATEQMIEAMNQELAIVEELLRSENASLTRKLDLQKRLSESEGRLGELNANYDKLKTAVLEARLELNNFKNENYREALKEINETNVNISNLQNELDSSSDILIRTAIKSPVAGFVMDLKYHAIGSVIPPASQIMFVVPKDDVLIAEVKINTRDIDLVAKDMKAKVHLTAYKSRLMPKLKGRVISVSADNFKNEATGEIYFKGRIEIPESELKKLSSDIKLTAGMPVEAYIITGTRSLLSYLFTPIKESAYKAFREE
jgi:HlyD family type I secretion membrane fusion protein